MTIVPKDGETLFHEGKYWSHDSIIVNGDLQKYFEQREFINFIMSLFIEPQKSMVSNILNILNKKLMTIKDSKAEKNSSERTTIEWNKTDTDFLELVTALIESRSIKNIENNLSRKQAIKELSLFFNLEIKDAESKLSRATDRKKDASPFLTTLKDSFDDYCRRKDERLDELKR